MLYLQSDERIRALLLAHACPTRVLDANVVRMERRGPATSACADYRGLHTRTLLRSPAAPPHAAHAAKCAASASMPPAAACSIRIYAARGRQCGGHALMGASRRGSTSPAAAARAGVPGTALGSERAQHTGMRLSPRAAPQLRAPGGGHQAQPGAQQRPAPAHSSLHSRGGLGHHGVEVVELVVGLRNNLLSGSQGREHLFAGKTRNE